MIIIHLEIIDQIINMATIILIEKINFIVEHQIEAVVLIVVEVMYVNEVIFVIVVIVVIFQTDIIILLNIIIIIIIIIINLHLNQIVTEILQTITKIKFKMIFMMKIYLI
jgi:hypothetical protein